MENAVENIENAAREIQPPQENPPSPDAREPVRDGAARAGQAPGDRDFAREVDELVREFPDAGKAGRLPDEVVRDALQGGKSVLEAYRDYALAEQGRSGTARQNAENARRAPVRGVSGGYAVENQGRDAFMSGFDAEP